MIYLCAGDTPHRLSIHLYWGLFKFIIFKYNIKCFCWDSTIKALGQRGRGRIIMHFFFGGAG